MYPVNKNLASDNDISNLEQTSGSQNSFELKKSIFERMQKNPFDFKDNLRSALIINKLNPQVSTEGHIIQFVRETYQTLETECNPTALADTRIAPK